MLILVGNCWLKDDTSKIHLTNQCISLLLLLFLQFQDVSIPIFQHFTSTFLLFQCFLHCCFVRRKHTSLPRRHRSEGRMVCCMLFVVTVLSDLPLGRISSPGHPQAVAAHETRHGPQHTENLGKSTVFSHLSSSKNLMGCVFLELGELC